MKFHLCACHVDIEMLTLCDLVITYGMIHISHHGIFLILFYANMQLGPQNIFIIFLLKIQTFTFTPIQLHLIQNWFSCPVIFFPGQMTWANTYGSDDSLFGGCLYWLPSPGKPLTALPRCCMEGIVLDSQVLGIQFHPSNIILSPH